MFSQVLGGKVFHKEQVIGLPADAAELGDRCRWHGFTMPSSAAGASGSFPFGFALGLQILPLEVASHAIKLLCLLNSFTFSISLAPHHDSVKLEGRHYHPHCTDEETEAYLGERT